MAIEFAEGVPIRFHGSQGIRGDALASPRRGKLGAEENAFRRRNEIHSATFQNFYFACRPSTLSVVGR